MSFPSRYFRAGVGAVIANTKGFVLVLERSTVPGAWQMPQGGIEANETPEDAVFREVKEETQLTKDHLQLVEQYPEPLVYELPSESQSEKTGMGQVQYWFLLRFRGNEQAIAFPAGGEFKAWAWLPPSQILSNAVAFRRHVYQRLLAQFEKHLHATLDSPST
jgi:putative (di)nucleoside polyphosphate hydrolase